jgi:hypothetical protein
MNMKKIRRMILFTIFATALGLSQNQSSPVQAAPAQAAPTVSPEAQLAAIRILAPIADQTLAGNSVDLRFEVVRPPLGSEPSFLVQIDDASPIKTSETSYTFSGVQAGIHSVRVTLMDVNNSPAPGGLATVQFNVPTSSQFAHTDNSRVARHRPTQAISGAAPGAPIPPELRADGDISFPMAGSPLPLLSLIGFGLLIGGATQTMRTS